MKDAYDVPLFKVLMDPSVPERAGATLMSGKISQFSKVADFEKVLAEHIGNPHVLTVNSGTTALHLAYHLLRDPIAELNYPGFSDGDEVLTTALTCVATNWPILANGLRIRWVDVDPASMNINMDDLRRKLSPRTKIISVVHWGGYPCDLNELKRIQHEAEAVLGFRPMVIEDGAHSFGAKFEGKALGCHGNLVMYSFQAIKHLTTVDGGLLVVPTQKLYDRGKLIRFFGIDRERKNSSKDFRVEDNIEEWGYKFHMNDVNATIGLCNFPLAARMLERHRDNANFYHFALQDIKGVKLLENKADREGAWWLFTLLVDRRDELIDFMRGHGIMVSQVHGRNDVHSCVREYLSPLPLLDAYEGRVVCIPVGWWVGTEEREKIVALMKQFFQQ